MLSPLGKIETSAVWAKPDGSVKVIVVSKTHPLISVIVTEYVPENKSVKSSEVLVNPLGPVHEYSYTGEPPAISKSIVPSFTQPDKLKPPA